MEQVSGVRLVIVLSALFVSGCGKSRAESFYETLWRNDAPGFTSMIQKDGLRNTEEAIGMPVLFAICGASGVDSREIMVSAVASGADVNQIFNGDTPLMQAAMWLRVEDARVLLASGADPAIRSSDGKTAVDLIADGGDAKAIEYLRTALHK